MIVMDEAGRHAMEANNKCKTEGIIVMPATVLDPPKAGGVKAVSETGKESPQRNVGIVARKATGRPRARRSAPVRINPD